MHFRVSVVHTGQRTVFSTYWTAGWQVAGAAAAGSHVAQPPATTFVAGMIPRAAVSKNNDLYEGCNIGFSLSRMQSFVERSYPESIIRKLGRLLTEYDRYRDPPTQVTQMGYIVVRRSSVTSIVRVLRGELQDSPQGTQRNAEGAWQFVSEEPAVTPP
jgi:hypothetical protein